MKYGFILLTVLVLTECVNAQVYSAPPYYMEIHQTQDSLLYQQGDDSAATAPTVTQLPYNWCWCFWRPSNTPYLFVCWKDTNGIQYDTVRKVVAGGSSTDTAIQAGAGIAIHYGSVRDTIVNTQTQGITSLVGAAPIRTATNGTIDTVALVHGADAQILVDSAGKNDRWVTMGGDANINALGVLTLGTVNSDVGTYGDATHSSQVTVTAKGLITAASNVAITTGLNPMKAVSNSYYYFPFPVWSTTGLATSAGFYYAIPFVPPFNITAKGIAITVLSTTGDTCRLGIYADNGSQYPGTLLFDAGKLGYASSSTGNKTLAVSPTVALSANTLYWLVYICKTGTTLFQIASSPSSATELPLLGVVVSGGNILAAYTNYNKSQSWAGISALPGSFPVGAALGVTSPVILIEQN